MASIKGIIFDYGGTLDSRGEHWSEVIWKGYQWYYSNTFSKHDTIAQVNKDQFREAYVAGERELARNRHIMPDDNFFTMMFKKAQIELNYMTHAEWIEADGDAIDRAARIIATFCDNAAKDCINEATPILQQLSQSFELMLVSNFYGNIDSVLRAYGIRQFFKGIIESAVVGIRKPNPTIFKLGVDALELPAHEVLVVGDSLKKDILPAESLGCRTLWLKGIGWTSEEENIERDDIINSITQVPSIVEKMI
ncbi:MAG: HAD family hydrolase [Muribaculaceae bacterium]|nr:HAD family hydrolase [Muribaculaceae bacterium]